MANEHKDNGRLASLLAAYGSDVSRWPAGERHRADRLSADERDRMFRDDKAFEQLLRGDRNASDQMPPPDALMSRILAAVPTGEAESRSGTVVSLEQRAANTAPAQSAPPQDAWRPVAALLAASLVLGIFIGSTAPGQLTARSIGEVAGIAFAGSEIQTSALADAFQIDDDEELL